MSVFFVFVLVVYLHLFGAAYGNKALNTTVSVCLHSLHHKLFIWEIILDCNHFIACFVFVLYLSSLSRVVAVYIVRCWRWILLGVVWKRVMGVHALETQWFDSDWHYSDVKMDTMTSQITNLTIVYLTVYPSADQRKYQSYASLAFVRGIHRWPVSFTHKGPVTRKMFPFDDVTMFLLFGYFQKF